MAQSSPDGASRSRRLRGAGDCAEINGPATPLSSCINADQSVVIGDGAKPGCTGTVAIDSSQVVGKITINNGGALVLNDSDATKSNPTITTTGIDIGSGGVMQLGCPADPIGGAKGTNQATILFTGNKPDSSVCGTPNNQPSSVCAGWVKGIQVESGGTLRMYGQKGVPPTGVSWTYLSQPAGPAKYQATDANYIKNVLAPVTAPANEIHLAADVGRGPAAWRAGDWIAIATTSFSPWEIEFVQLASDPIKEGTGSKLTLVQPLVYYHFGGAAPGSPDKNYSADASLNYGIDERAEVGLISRNILLTSDADLANGAKHWGGEIRILPGFTGVSLQGVELQKFGKEQLGSYPIHFHQDGDLSSYQPADKLIDANSIDHSYNKCITVHSTSNLTISNNVCARITGHIFYEEAGDEFNIAFTGNLGMGAMNNSFDVNTAAPADRTSLLEKYYWAGDNMAPGGIAPLAIMEPTNIGFDQIGIVDTDYQNNPVHGVCGHFQFDGKLLTDRNDQLPNCVAPSTYFEAPSGFWIVNPSTKLTGNSIAGCQDVGKAYWYVPPRDASNTAVKFIPIGAQYSAYGPSKYGLFQNNRGHACYSGLYDEDDGLASSDQLSGYQNAIHDTDHQAVVDEFDDLTLSRIRDRGVWLRPTFFFLKNARVATTRDGVSLVTSGGIDGNYPGVWGLLEDSVVAGISTNNVDRWGPCGATINGVPPVGQVRGGVWGCIDQTNPDNLGSCGTADQPACNPVNGGEFTDRGYATPDWPMFGFLIYDGPPLMIHDRFVDFRVAPGSVASDGFTGANLLTGTDDDLLKTWNFYGIPMCPTNPPAYTTYEGDAALGWFNANQSSYPAATTTDKLTFTNVDLRHQIYTAQVNRGDFTDGDENTTILDLDGSLSNVTAIDAISGESIPSISLNNLGINASANSVDECHSEGAEDNKLEGRPTSTMVPSALGQLEFEMLYPPRPVPDRTGVGHTELLTFAKNTTDFDAILSGYHGTMPLKSRNGLGDWEPKVTSGYGYTVTAGSYKRTDCTVLPPSGTQPGMGSMMDVTLTDIVNAPELSADHPFYVQLGICLTNADGTHPADGFTITRGYRSYGGGNVVSPPNSTLSKYWGGFLACNGLDSQMAEAAKTPNTMPAACPAVSSGGSPVTTLSEVRPISKMTTDGTLNGKPLLDNYFYDATNGWLFMWVAQTEPNAQGPSPLGNCTGGADDPSFCPSKTTGESYYVCPAEGCPTYRIVVKDANYTPGLSNCGDPYSAAQGYSWPGPPAGENSLVIAGTKDSVIRQAQGGTGGKFPHYATTSALNCPVTTP